MLKHVASLSDFFLDTSWSAYNARRNKANIVPYFNSILPLLRQNVANFRTQKHCTGIVEPTINLLNPVQAMVDTSDQLVYVPSNRLKQVYPHNFG